MRPRHTSRYDDYTPIESIENDIAEARRRRDIYQIACRIAILKARGIASARLSTHERRMLMRALRRARYGRKPLAKWLPRGYQIVRFMYLAKILAPRLGFRVTARDKRLIRAAASQIRREGEKWGRHQLPSLMHCAKAVCRTFEQSAR